MDKVEAAVLIQSFLSSIESCGIRVEVYGEMTVRDLTNGMDPEVEVWNRGGVAYLEMP